MYNVLTKQIFNSVSARGVILQLSGLKSYYMKFFITSAFKKREKLNRIQFYKNHPGDVLMVGVHITFYSISASPNMLIFYAANVSSREGGFIIMTRI
jgi:hypothetical protein